MAMKHFGIFLGAALLVGTACSHSKEYARNDTGMNNPSAGTSGGTQGQGATAGNESIAREKDALISQADGSQLGTLRDYSGTTLTVDADNAGANGSMTMRVDNSVPVFQGQQKVSTDALVPGSDVRVFYRTPTDGTQPQAVAIEVLNNGKNSTMPGSQGNSGSQGGMQKGSQDNSGSQGGFQNDSRDNGADDSGFGSGSQDDSYNNGSGNE